MDTNGKCLTSYWHTRDREDVLRWLIKKMKLEILHEESGVPVGVSIGRDILLELIQSSLSISELTYVLNKFRTTLCEMYDALSRSQNPSVA